ncbi:hypothetical protein KKF91_13180 [Myxococcota bacterium]|nr:hypothetical protein [Myxococcota bacterium]MBU1431489.1 hypothetical protein [Myxococcota bacterium]MBU1900621.1 hypothetical protein [Myxococcota bacterium]
MSERMMDKAAASHALESQSQQEMFESDPRAQAAWQGYMRQLQAKPAKEEDTLEDLTASQQRYVKTLKAVEAANPKAGPQDIAMSISLLLWGGRIWDHDGKAADVTRPAGVPLVLDYQGGEGYKDVKMTDRQSQFFQNQRGVTDQHGLKSGVAHAFPAVAALAGREDTVKGDYNAHMVTKGGDFIQDMARMIVELNFETVFRDAEARDNERALELAHKNAGSSRPLSESLAEQFRLENMEAEAREKKKQEMSKVGFQPL